MSEAEDGLIEIVTTVSSEREALELARTLIDESLAACVSLDEVRSIYRWKGEVCDERETRLVVKTTAGMAGRAAVRIGVLHPYETPAIVRLPVLAASAEYRQWVRHSVGEGGES